MKNITQFKRLQNTLMIAFLVLSITPLTLSALFFMNSHTKDLVEQSTSHLASLLDNKKKQLNNFFTAKESEAQSFARSELANASGGRFYGLVGAFHQLGELPSKLDDNNRSTYFTHTLTEKGKSINAHSTNYIGHERYRLMYKRYHWAFEEYLKRSDFSDIMLVDIKGNVVYSVNHPERFGIGLNDPRFSGSELSNTFKAIKEQTSDMQSQPEQVPIAFTDFSANKDQSSQTAWFAAPVIQQGYLHSYVFFELSNKRISSLIADTPPTSNYVQTLLVGSDHQPRIPTTSEGSNPLNSESINQALEGNIGVGSFLNFSQTPVLSAFSPINVLGNTWALVVELPEEEAFARIRQIEKIFLVAMITAIVLVIIASHLLSNSITAPLLRLTWAAERVSAGDLDQKIEGIERSDEIGRLAVSFARMQRSVREKISLIRDQNTELEQNLKVIQQQNKELQVTDKLKDEFLATTSHELRTPLHGMVGIAESLLAGANGPVQASQRRQLEMLINSGQRLTNLVDDLLDYHKMRYGDLDINKHAVDLSSATHLVLELSRHLVGSKPIRIINQIPADLPPVLADEQRLEQVLYNLIAMPLNTPRKVKLSCLQWC